MMYQSERMYVHVREREFTFSASRSMIAEGGIENLISNYVGGMPAISNYSFGAIHGSPKVYNLDARPVEVIESRMPRLLEYKAKGGAPEGNTSSSAVYNSFNYNPLSYMTRPTQQYFAAENFLNTYRSDTQFVDDAKQIEEHIKEAFRQTTGDELPAHIKITVCDKDKFKAMNEISGGKWNDGIQGFSVHRTKEIFVKNNKLDVVMLVVGHELGHVLSSPMGNIHDEEAKAFAFELAWMKAIKENNIADLADNINIDFKPANNGLHDRAFAFVKRLVERGKEALEVFKEIVSGDVSMEFSSC